MLQCHTRDPLERNNLDCRSTSTAICVDTDHCTCPHRRHLEVSHQPAIGSLPLRSRGKHIMEIQRIAARALCKISHRIGVSKVGENEGIASISTCQDVIPGTTD